ncbi:MAG: stalk domain-containing protein [Lachnospirales bacterium]
MNKLIIIFVLLFSVLCFKVDVFAMTVADSFNGALTQGVKKFGSLDFVINISDKKINETINNTKINGNLPVVTTSNTTFDEQINGAIADDYDEKMTEVKKTNAKSVSVSYNVYTSSDIYSIVVEYTLKNLTNKIYAETYVFDSKGNFLNLNSYLGKNSTKILTSYVNSLDSDTNNDVTIEKDHDFYVETGLLNVVFDSGVLTPVYEGLYSVEINPNSIKYKNVPEENYFIQDSFSLRMVPLEECAIFFGYTVEYGDDGIINVKKDDFTSVIDTTLKSNNYYKNGSLINLETVPITKDAKVYVPLTYFSDVLDLVYYFGDDNSITILSIN